MPPFEHALMELHHMPEDAPCPPSPPTGLDNPKTSNPLTGAFEYIFDKEEKCCIKVVYPTLLKVIVPQYIGVKGLIHFFFFFKLTNQVVRVN